jgi:hypothetical protein
MRVVAAAGLVLVLASPAAAAEWREIKPGETMMSEIRARFGTPTTATPQKVEGYDTMQWVYEGAQAPVGMVKMTIDFGLKTPAAYNKDVVRTFTLVPKHDIYNRKLILDGWGPPDRVGKQGETEFFLYASGLLVYFDKDGRLAVSMVFTPPQPLSP